LRSSLIVVITLSVELNACAVDNQVHSKEGDGHLNETFKTFPLSSFPPPPLGFVAVMDSDMSIFEAAKVSFCLLLTIE
jgi:hypothetical protein